MSRQTVRELSANEVAFRIECLPEDVPVEGNALASGDDEADREQEAWILEQLDNGNDWAWCTVRVVASWHDWEGDSYLSCCSYRSEADFCQEGGYLDDMKSEALAALNASVQASAEALHELSDYCPRFRDLDAFTRAYVECALWSSTDEEGEPLDGLYTPDDLAPETLRDMVEDCASFQKTHAERIASDPARAGQDFWLTRNRHGAGFWDGDYPDDDGKALTEDAHAYGSRDLYVGDDGFIYQQ